MGPSYSVSNPLYSQWIAPATHTKQALFLRGVSGIVCAMGPLRYPGAVAQGSLTTECVSGYFGRQCTTLQNSQGDRGAVCAAWSYKKER